MSPMPRMRCGQRSGWNSSRPSVRSPVPMELDRHAGDALTESRGAAARVAVHLGQDQAGDLAGRWWKASAAVTDSWPSWRRPPAASRRRDGAGDATSSSITRLVDVQPAGGVEQDDVVPPLAGGVQAARCATLGRRADRSGVDLDADLLAHDLELSTARAARRRRPPAAASAAPCAGDRQLGAASSCPSPAGRRSARRRPFRAARSARAPEPINELVVNGLDDLLSRAGPR